MKLLKSMKAYVQNIKTTAAQTGLSKLEKIGVCFDIIYCRLRFGITCSEYRAYHLHKYQDNYRKNFLLARHLKQKYGNAFDSDRSKYRLYQAIKIGYSRGIILLPACGEESFLAFFRKHRKIILKPDIGNGGQNIEIVEYQDDAHARTLFQSIHQDTVCEEFVYQHEEMNAMNPHCVNTIRIVTLYTGEKFDIICATLKTNIRPEVPTDNFHTGGIGAAIHVPTGVVNSFARGYNRQVYLNHPITGYQILGMRIPYWEEAKLLIRDAHKNIPATPVVGWDIAITPNGPVIIEANLAPGPFLMQLMDQIPKGELLIKHMKSQKKKKK